MNVAMKLLLSLGVKMEQADGGEQGGSNANDTSAAGSEPNRLDFQPVEVQQGTGLHDRQASQQRQQQEDSEEADVDSLDTSDIDDDENEEDVGAEDKSTEHEEEEQDTDSEEDLDEESTGEKYFYEGVEVEIVNDPQVSSQLKEKGFDINEVNKEIYSEKGLSIEMYGKLSDAFGRPVVDLYLESLKRANQATIAKNQADQVTFEADYKAMANKATGGKLAEVLQWANKNLSAEDYKRYQTVVNSGNTEAAQFALESMTLQFNQSHGETNKKVEENPRKRAVDTSTATKSGGDVGLSLAEYQQLFVPTTQYPQGQYYSDPDKYDSLRALGKRSGK